MKAKSDKYESFCREVTADKALIKFWNLYSSMQNKTKSKNIPDFTNDRGVWMRNDCEKGEALFERYTKQTDQQNEDERLMYVRRLRAHYEDDPSSVEIRPDIVRHHIRSSCDSAPGPDGVRYSHMKGVKKSKSLSSPLYSRRV